MGGEEIKVPPQNVEAEKSVLGAMLMDSEAIGMAIEVLDARWFYEEAHRIIFTAIIDLYNDRKNVDLITISDKLKDAGTLDSIGGIPYLSLIIDRVPTSANIEYHSQIVKEKGILRHLIKNATHIVNECYSSGGDIAEVVDTAERLVFEISDLKHRQSSVHVKDLVKSSIEKIDSLYQRKEHVYWPFIWIC